MSLPSYPAAFDATPTPRTQAAPRPLLTSAMCLALLLSGCANMDETDRGTATGAAIGAVAGAVIGSATGKNGVAGAAIGGVAGAVIGNVWSKRMQAQREAMEQATRGTDVEVTRTPDNQLKVNIPSDISFAKNSAAIRPELREVLEAFGNGLKQDSGGMIVRIVGHTDSTGSPAINNPLSQERADSVKSFLVDRGVPAGRIETAGRGENEPLVSNDTPEGQAKNRRVEIFLREPAPQS